MRIRSPLAAKVYRVLLVLAAALGLALTTKVFSGTVSFYTYRYYTVQSNLLCLLFFVGLLALGSRAPRWYAVTLKGAVTMAITVTMLIYQFMLAETPFAMSGGEGALENLLTHLVVPVLVLADWLLFDAKGRYRAVDPVWWLGIPLLYVGYAFVGAQLGMTYFGGSRFPYFFLDVDALGVPGVLKMIGLLALAFLALGYVFYGLDRVMGRKGNNGDS